MLVLIPVTSEQPYSLVTYAFVQTLAVMHMLHKRITHTGLSVTGLHLDGRWPQLKVLVNRKKVFISESGRWVIKCIIFSILLIISFITHASLNSYTHFDYHLLDQSNIQ